MIWRSLFFFLITLPVMVVLGAVQTLIIWSGSRHWHMLPRLTHRLVCFNLGLDIRQIGQPAKDRPTLLLSNHISWLDIPAIGAVAPVSFVAKSEVGRWPIIGFLANLQKTIYVDRRKKTDTGRVASEMGKRLSNGQSVLLFAEGTSDVGLHVLPFRSALVGSAEAAIRNAHTEHLYIQPMVIAYTHLNGLPISRAERSKIAWIGDMGITDNMGDILRAGTKSVTIMFGEPFMFTPHDDRKIIAAKAEAAARDMLVAINRQTLLPNAHKG